MEILVNRAFQSKNTTVSSILVDGEHQCFGLENSQNIPKIAGKTRIPDGKYRVGLRTVGGKHNRYNELYPHWHVGMLHILDVPDFQYVLIHIGNYHRDTDGCLLVGETIASHAAFEYMIGNSRVAYERLYTKVMVAAGNGILSIEFKHVV